MTDGLSSGAIAGIVIAVLVAILIAVSVLEILLLYLRMRKSEKVEAGTYFITIICCTSGKRMSFIKTQCKWKDFDLLLLPHS